MSCPICLQEAPDVCRSTRSTASALASGATPGVRSRDPLCSAWKSLPVVWSTGWTKHQTVPSPSVCDPPGGAKFQTLHSSNSKEHPWEFFECPFQMLKKKRSRFHVGTPCAILLRKKQILNGISTRVPVSIEWQIEFQIEWQNICQIDCQIECQKECQIECQIECQKVCQIECKKEFQIECHMEVRIYVRKNAR